MLQINCQNHSTQLNNYMQFLLTLISLFIAFRIGNSQDLKKFRHDSIISKLSSEMRHVAGAQCENVRC